MDQSMDYIFEELEDDELMHIGVLERSGRFPWGSGENPYQRLGGIIGERNRLKKEGLSDSEIAAQLGMTVNELRAKNTYYVALNKRHWIAKCSEMADKGMSNLEISRKTGLSASTVANYLKQTDEARSDVIFSTMDAIRNQIGDNGFVDVGKGTEAQLNIKATKLKYAVSNLVDEGYELYSDVYVKQGGKDNYSTVKVLAAPGITKREIYDRLDELKTMDCRSEDGGKTFSTPEPPVNIKLDRVDFRYADDPISGTDMDGVIEIRRGVKDLDLGDAHYAQVRIGVDGTHYLKGMAMYSDDLPDGVDVRFNTNKNRADGPYKAMKPQKTKAGSDEIDEIDPFGTSIKDQQALRMVQRTYVDDDGTRKLSALNVVNEEGSWEDWSRNLPSQFLTKQSPKLAIQQLDIEAKTREKQFEDITKLTNPVLQEKMLKDFADDCDSAAVHLKAAALPRQCTHVILPVRSLKENEVFAPRFDDGEEVVLVRFPHGGIFEIPRLTVNNRNREARKSITTEARDAVGINPKTAAILSGADFDGDTVLVLPTKNHEIKNRSPLFGLKDFDPKTAYSTTEEQRESGAVKIMSEKMKGMEMGKITNLITDMSIVGDATDDELARAIRHSMVVIDAVKHKLDYQQSYKDNGIAELKNKYQPATGDKKQAGGASTLISRAKSPQKVDDRKSYYRIDPKTGEKIFIPTYEMKPVRKKVKNPETGEMEWTTTGWTKKQKDSTKMYEAKDAYSLTSGGSKSDPGTVIEGVYAEYANRMKALGDTARKTLANLPKQEANPNAKTVYKKETDHLLWQLNEAKKNAPLERKALALAQSIVKLSEQENPSMTASEKSKVRDRALKRARGIVGAKRYEIEISDREWEAIQAGAVSKGNQIDIFRYTDQDKLKERAMPKKTVELSSSLLSTARSMLDRGYTWEEVAQRFGVSVSTLSNHMK